MSEFTVGISDDTVGISEITEGLPETSEGISKTGASEATDGIKWYPIGKLRQDRGRNPRKAKRYSAKELSPLARSIAKHGVQEPPTVSERENGEPWVLKGHRRLACVILLQTEGLAKDAFGPAIAPMPDFMPRIRCRILRGLTIEGEIDLVMDHGEVQKLDKQERLLAARIMTGYGLSHEFIATKVGGSRSNYTNGLAKILALPPIVETTYLSEEDGAPSITQPTLKLLKIAYDRDIASRDCKLKEEGPAFKAAWEFFLKNGTDKIKVMPRKDLLNVATSVIDPDLRNLLAALAENDKGTVGTLLESLALRLSDLATVGTGFVRIEEGIETTVKDFVPVGE